MNSRLYSKQSILFLSLTFFALLIANGIILSHFPHERSSTVGSATAEVQLCIYYTPEILTGNQTLTNETFTLQLDYTNLNNNTLTFYDNTSFFEINSTTGLINFTPLIIWNGTWDIHIWFNETGECSRSGASKTITFDIKSNPGSSFNPSKVEGVSAIPDRERNPETQAPEVVQPFALEKELILLSLIPGQTTIISTNVYNLLQNAIPLQILSSPKNSFIRNIAYDLYLPPEGEYLFTTKFTPDLTLPGIYTDSITFTSNGYQKDLIVIITYNLPSVLFGYEMSIGDKTLSEGENLSYDITLKKFGNFLSTNATLTYAIIDLEGNTYTSGNESFLFSSNTTMQKTLSISLEPKQYVLFTSLKAENITIYSSDSFQVQAQPQFFREKKSAFPLLILYLILILLAILAAMIIKTNIYKKKHIPKEMK